MNIDDLKLMYAEEIEINKKYIKDFATKIINNNDIEKIKQLTNLINESASKIKIYTSLIHSLK